MKHGTPVRIIKEGLENTVGVIEGDVIQADDADWYFVQLGKEAKSYWPFRASEIEEIIDNNINTG